jgi:hypothetical protein
MTTLIVQDRATEEFMAKFEPIDFTDVLAMLSRFENANQTLSDDEKSSAIEVVREWEKNAKYRLKEKHKFIEKFIGYYNHNYLDYDDITLEQAQIVAKLTDTEALLETMVGTRKAYQLEQQDPPQSPVEDLSKTRYQLKLDQKTYKMQLFMYQKRMLSLERKHHAAMNNWMRAVKDTAVFKELRKKCKDFQSNYESLRKKIEQIQENITINVIITSDSIRQAILQMLRA